MNQDLFDNNSESVGYTDGQIFSSRLPKYQADMISKLEEINNRCWTKGDGFKAPHYPQMTEYTGGWDDGLYFVAGAANTGKSAEMMNIVHDLVTHEANNMFALYFSLDDSLNETVPRMIAMEQKVAIDVIKKPKKYDTDDKLMSKRQRGFESLKDATRNLMLFDNGECPFIEDIESKIKEFKILLAEQDRPDAKFIIVIDAFDDLDSRDVKFRDDNSKSAHISKWVKDLTKEYDCIVFCTKHLRKLNGYRRPTVDDIKDSGTLVYEANLILLCYNEVGLKDEKADIYYNRSGVTAKQPIIEVHFAKNKLTSFKGRVFTRFIPDFSHVEECSIDECRQYNTLVFQA